MPSRAFRWCFVVASIVVAVDQVTKNWAEGALAATSCSADPDACIEVFWTLQLHLHYNTGAAFSTGTGFGPLLAAVAAVMSVVLFGMARHRSDRLGPVLLGLIAGGAIGNLADRLIRATDGIATGAVIDFIDFQWWPIFNVADSAVVVGVLAFILYSLVAPDAGTSASAPATVGTAEPGESDADGAAEPGESAAVGTAEPGDPAEVDGGSAATGADRAPSR